MASPENTFLAAVHRYLPHELYRMKNHNQYNGGIPDVWYSGPGGDVWVEYKFTSLPKRSGTMIKVELSALQKNWLLSRHSEGRNVGVIVGCKEGGVWMPGVTWQISHTRDSFCDALKSRTDLASIICSYCVLAGSRPLLR